MNVQCLDVSKWWTYCFSKGGKSYCNCFEKNWLRASYGSIFIKSHPSVLESVRGWEANETEFIRREN